ncbi:MAG: polyketide cyclase [Frankiales bacterium]|nr:polyketide cyclase [Frankiales bacterium]
MIGERWGVTDAEVARRYPCDDVLLSPALQLWRGVTVHASPGEVWPWLCQVRLAPYSYDWLDNLGHRSPRELRGLPDPRPGEPFSCVGGRIKVGRVLSVVHEQQLTANILGAVMSYVLCPDGGSTRLLLKIVMEHDRWYAKPVALGDWPMARRQLKNFKALAEAGRAPGARTPLPS